MYQNDNILVYLPKKFKDYQVNINEIKLKVCGMKYAGNLKELVALAPDYVGFIFFPESPRYMAKTLSPADLQGVPEDIKKTGVFVNGNTEAMLAIGQEYQLNVLQLHGTESPEQCRVLKAAGYEIIKVFVIGDADFDFRQLAPYKPHVHYFLFDTKTQHHGGSGHAFDWKVLQQYDNEIPFFLSGGISMENVDQIGLLKETNLYAIDVNSRFETAPGQKNIGSLQQLKEKLYKINEEITSSQ